MNRLPLVALTALLMCQVIAAQPSSRPEHSIASAFINVNVVPMNSEKILTAQTLIVKNGLIAQIGPAAKIKVPRDAVRIEARNKYLMPGLADMHTHLYDTDSRSLLHYLTTGVTTIRVMNGRPHQLAWRERGKRGELVGPNLFIASPTIYGRPNSSSARAGFNEPATPAEAEALVATYKGAGYDFIKIYSFLSPEIYAAIMRSAREHDIEVVGHVPWSVGIVGALNSGQSSVEHLFGYLEEIETEESKKRRVTDFRNLFHAIEFHEDRLAALVSATRVAGVWNTPTMVFFEKRLPFSGAKEAWENASLRKLGHENRATIVGALNKSGARLLLGTDSGEGQGSILPAAIVEELALLVEAGLTPYQALKTGTVNAAAYLERSKDFGILTKGMRADLLLIECDPLSNVSCVKEQSGIMIGGRWFTKQDLSNMLKANAVKE